MRDARRIKNYNAANFMKAKTVIVGSGWSGRTIASILLQRKGYELVGFVDDGSQDGQVTVPCKDGDHRYPRLGDMRALMKIIDDYKVDVVVLADENKRPDHLLQQIVKCYEKGIHVYEMPDLYAKMTCKIPVLHVNNHWMMPRLSEPPHDFYTLFHDVTNYVASIVGLLCVAPLFPFIALAIKIDSSGPAFYTQLRIGKNGHIFRLLKFRTMVTDADQNGDSWTRKDDVRITRFGRWLRKYRLDELPQLINILKGDMALVGPRPDAANLAERFRKEIPFYDYRHLVRPGITGWAQVNHGNTCTIRDALEKLQYDLYWIKNRSFSLDLRIIFRSIKVILTGYGAV